MTLLQELGKVLELITAHQRDGSSHSFPIVAAAAMDFLCTHGPALLALAESAERPVAWMRYGPDGKPDWAEDCLSDRDELDADQIADGYTMRPLFTLPEIDP